MNRTLAVVSSITVLAASAVAQTVTGSGTTNTVPVFTNTSAIGNSPVTVSGSNVGIGTTSPSLKLTVASGVYGNPATSGTLQAGGAARISGADNGVLDIGEYNGNGSFWIQATDRTTLAQDYDLSLNPNGGNVGLGTANPPLELSVVSRVYGSPATSGTTQAGGAVRISGADNGVLDIGEYKGNGSFWIQATDQTTLAQNYNLTLNPNGGSVGIGTASPGAKLEVNGGVKLTSGSGASITFADGTIQSTAYTGITCGGDYAESIDLADDRKSYAPGDLLVIDATDPSKFHKSGEAYSTAVAGIFSTKPGTVGRRQTIPKSPDEIPMAVVGIVPAKVSAENGPIGPSDLLVSSSTPGYAMKGTDRSRMLGAVIGKAMGKLDSGTGVIEVLVTLQ